MEELSDKDFDQIFKNRIKDGYLEFEEESWLKMEKKLRSRNRYVFLRNASIILLFLSFGFGIYVISGEKLKTEESRAVKTIKKASEPAIAKTASLEKNDGNLLAPTLTQEYSSSINEKLAKLHPKNRSFVVKPKIIPSTTSALAIQSKAIANQIIIVQNSVQDSSKAIVQQQVTSQSDPIQQQKNAGGLIDVSRGKSMAKHGIVLSVLVGPDFNSTENAIGGKRGTALGIGVSIPLSRKLSIQTGINYGSKNYEAQGYDYAFNNPNTVNLISGIDASCKVLEIPLRASYTVIDKQKSSIDLSAGLSSYFILKENYRFIYTEASGRKDRFLEEKNANQHYLSIIDLSATYNVKLKNKRFALGLQPYVKIPISGIGEGNVPLKSSGIALKLNYELIKKK